MARRKESEDKDMKSEDKARMLNEAVKHPVSTEVANDDQLIKPEDADKGVAFVDAETGAVVGQPPRNEFGERLDVPLPDNSVPNVPNPSNDPKHPAQPSGTFVPNNANNAKPV